MKIREVKEDERVRPLLVPLAISAAVLIAAGWTGHVLLKKTRFRRAARLARRIETAGQRLDTLSRERDVHPVFSEDETGA